MGERRSRYIEIGNQGTAVPAPGNSSSCTRCLDSFSPQPFFGFFAETSQYHGQSLSIPSPKYCTLMTIPSLKMLPRNPSISLSPGPFYYNHMRSKYRYARFLRDIDSVLNHKLQTIQKEDVVDSSTSGYQGPWRRVSDSAAAEYSRLMFPSREPSSGRGGRDESESRGRAVAMLNRDTLPKGFSRERKGDPGSLSRGRSRGYDGRSRFSSCTCGRHGVVSQHFDSGPTFLIFRWPLT